MEKTAIRAISNDIVRPVAGSITIIAKNAVTLSETLDVTSNADLAGGTISVSGSNIRLATGITNIALLASSKSVQGGRVELTATNSGIDLRKSDVQINS